MSKQHILSEEKVKEILLKGGHVSEKGIKEADLFSKKDQRGFVEALIEKSLISREGFGKAVAKDFKVPYADLDAHAPTEDLVKKIPERISKKYRLVVAKIGPKRVIVTTDNPSKKGLMLLAEKIFKDKNIVIAYSLPDTIDIAFLHYRQSLQKTVEEILDHDENDAPNVIKAIFTEALILRVSDVHFEPRLEDVVIRFRVDGLLREVLILDHVIYGNVVNRIKVESHLRIDDHFSAQDGAMHFNGEEASADLRVSIVPTTYGEKIVIRILSRYVKGLSFSDLGMSDENQLIINRASKKPFGMILVVGPTGSGKTTTLYSLISMLNRPDVNITTIEDPVEYKMPGVNQIQVNTATGLTFARGLRSIVRQDPDVVLVGEIRDRETAEIAVNAALTGHLVLSTFHANDAATAIPRLLDMGIEPFLLASTMELIIGQRLMRKLAEGSKRKVKLDRKPLQTQYPGIDKYLGEKDFMYYEPEARDDENGVAFEGRGAIYEMVEVTDELEELIIKRPSAREMFKVAKEQGMTTMFEDGLKKVKNGSTSLSELFRVIQPPSKMLDESINNQIKNGKTKTKTIKKTKTNKAKK